MHKLLKNKYNILLKYSLLLLGLFLFLTQNIFASQADELMKQANNYYQNNKYEQAIQTYQKIVKMGYQSDALFYNLGNAYYREGKLGYAILNYNKALQLSPGDEDVQHNLALANSKTIDKINTLPGFFLFDWWESLLALFNVSGWTFLAYAFYILLLIAIGLYFFAKKPKLQRYSFFSGIILVAFLIVTLAIFGFKLIRELNMKNAVVVQKAVTVKLSPDESSNDAFVIHEGLKVRIEDHVDNWVEIRLQDGKIGWMPKKDLRVI